MGFGSLAHGRGHDCDIFGSSDSIYLIPAILIKPGKPARSRTGAGRDAGAPSMADRQITRCRVPKADRRSTLSWLLTQPSPTRHPPKTHSERTPYPFKTHSLHNGHPRVTQNQVGMDWVIIGLGLGNGWVAVGFPVDGAPPWTRLRRRRIFRLQLPYSSRSH